MCADSVPRALTARVVAYARPMPRSPRVEIPGGFWHLIARGVRKEPIFTDDRDYERFLQLLAEVIEQFGWICHAYCLMPNHYHLVVETPRATLSDGMERLNGRYAQWFNRRHGLEGHVFERRFRSVPVVGDAHVLELSRYVVLNPVRAGLCRDAAGWRWSSFRAAVGIARRPKFLTVDWLAGMFGPSRRTARESYLRFVHGAPARASP
jgi:REP element-mobilizing transposase RayT